MTANRFARVPTQVAVLTVVVLATFASSLFNGFALDDNYIVAANDRVHQLGDLSRIWLTPYWPSFGEHLGLYRPLAIFGYAIQWAIGDGEPWVFHAVNVLMHLTVSVLVLFLLRRLASHRAALVGALLFAVHPVHTEVVANVVGQAEMIAAAGVVAACLVHAARPVDRLAPGWMRLGAIVALFLLALLAKEGAVVLPALLVAIDAAQGRVRFDRGTLARYTRAMALPLVILAVGFAAYLSLRLSVIGSIGGVDAAPNLPFLREEGRIFSALRAWPEYVRLAVWPFNLSADYSPGVILPATGFTPMVVLGTVLLVATAAIALATPIWPAPGLPAAWFVIAVFPVSNLVLPIGVLLAERVLYLPSVAMSIVAAAVFDHVRVRAQSRHKPRRIAFAATAALLVAFAIRSALRNPDWKDTPAVWDALVRDHPESYRAQWVNGFRMRQRGNLDLARQYLEIAYNIWPDDAQMLNALGGLYIQLGQYPKAIPILERARQTSGLLRDTEVLLGYAYLTQERSSEALDAIDRAAGLGSDSATVYALRAQALGGLGRFGDAAEAWSAVVRTEKGRTWALWSMYARDLARIGRTTDALAASDSAAATTDAQAILDGIEALRSAIRNRCYAIPATPRPADSGCTDPLAGWAVVLPEGAQEIAIELQNARQ